MARKATFIVAGALAFALLSACPALAAAATPSHHETVVGVAGAVLTSDKTNDESSLPAALKGETEIEKLTLAYDQALDNLKAAENEIARIQARVAELEEMLPAQQARSDAGIKQRYIMQSNPLAIAEPLLSSQSLDDFIRHADYLQKLSKWNLEEFNKTCELKDQLDEAKQEQESVREEASSKVQEAQDALEKEQDERAEKQAKGQSDAVEQAAAANKKKSDDDDESDDKAGDKSDDDDDPDDPDDSDDDDGETATQETGDLIDGANWHASRDEFIEEWAKRLDDYLKGTPLEGQGVNFAASAWKYCIDPRWSAAISNTESSKGTYCIRPHNAWGWGAADSDPYNLASEWDSWEEAIDAHAAGLAKGYGYTITMGGAQSYCPPTWQHWYNRTLAEMAKI